MSKGGMFNEATFQNILLTSLGNGNLIWRPYSERNMELSKLGEKKLCNKIN